MPIRNDIWSWHTWCMVSAIVVRKEIAFHKLLIHETGMQKLLGWLQSPVTVMKGRGALFSLQIIQHKFTLLESPALIAINDGVQTTLHLEQLVACHVMR